VSVAPVFAADAPWLSVLGGTPRLYGCLPVPDFLHQLYRFGLVFSRVLASRLSVCF
jgi:hypothetical protein